MEIDDVEYVDDLLRGMESKLGATVPLCLLQPILAAASSASVPPPSFPSSSPPVGAEPGPPGLLALAGGGSCSTPVKRRGGGPTGQAGQLGPSSSFPADVEALSPIRQLTAKRKRLEDNCCKLKDDMSALRAMDVSLMRQFLTVYDAVEELRWMMESYDMNDSCESISSSVSESMEQIHEKWMTERRQWQSTSSQNLANWREDSRFNISHVGRLNSTGGRRQDYLAGPAGRPTWRSIPQQKADALMNSSFPEFTSRRMSNFERQRRSSVDDLPLPKAESPRPASPPAETRQRRRSSSGALDLEAVMGVEDSDGGGSDKTTTTAAAEGQGGGNLVTKKPKFLYHSKSSPSFKTQLSLAVSDTAVI